MLVTVAICTRNRAQQLARTLSSIQRLRLSDEISLELMVINNACTDGTDDVIDDYRSTLPVRRVYVPELGVSNARNASIAAAEGELIIWTDDDVLVHPDWVTEYVRASQEWPKASFFGGTIEPLFEGVVPGWLSPGLRGPAGPYGFCKYSDKEHHFVRTNFLMLEIWQ